MYRIAYCDSDPIGNEPFLRTLEQVLEDAGRTCLVSHFSDKEQLLAALARDPSAYALVFLDAAADGLETAARLRQLASRLPVVLLGGEPADETVPSLHYLRSPVSYTRLKGILLCALQPPSPLLLRQPNSVQMVSLNQILYIEIFGHQLKIHTLAQQVLSATGTLSRIQRETPAGQFLRCHNSYLVNLAHVEGIRRYQILLSSGQSIPTSKKNYNQVRQSVMDYFARQVQSGAAPAIQELKRGPVP